MCVRTGIQAMRAKAISPGPEKKKTNRPGMRACAVSCHARCRCCPPPFCMETPRELFGAFPSREGVPSCR